VKLYHVSWCPECQIVRDKLDDLAIPYESIVVPDRRGMRAEVYDVSGQYYVPVLTDGDKVFTETDEILAYLATKHGQQAERA
jgi:mycoredoxin